MSPIRLLVDGPQNRYRNMAVDEALLRLVTVPVLRMYRWSEPNALSLGYFDRYTDAGDRPFVRRYTGGGLVDHEKDFTYTIILPKEHPLALAGTGPSYEAFHRGVLGALLREGIDAVLAPVADAVESNACFQKAVKFDVVDGRGRKLAGGAQRRTKTGCLHQGSILVDHLMFDSYAANLAAALAPELGGIMETSCLTMEENTLALELEKNRYSSAEWNLSR